MHLHKRPEQTSDSPCFRRLNLRDRFFKITRNNVFSCEVQSSSKARQENFPGNSQRNLVSNKSERWRTSTSKLLDRRHQRIISLFHFSWRELMADSPLVSLTSFQPCWTVYGVIENKAIKSTHQRFHHHEKDTHNIYCPPHQHHNESKQQPLCRRGIPP